MKTLLLLFVAGAILPSLQAGPISIQDPSFEPPVTTGLRGAGQTIGGWDVVTGSAQLFATGGGDFAQQGTQYLFLPGTPVNEGEVSQTLNGFVPGIEYIGTYYLCGHNTDGSPRQCSIEIALFNMKLDSFEYAVPGNYDMIGNEGQIWIERTFRIVAPSTSGLLNIDVYRSDMVNDCYATFDNFSIRPVPKGRPSTKVKSPRSKRSSTSGSKVTIRGQSKGILPPEFVVIQVGKKRKTIPGRKSWRAKVRLRPGTNKVKIQTIDIAGTASKKVTRVIQR